MVLTERDKELLKMLQSFGILTTKQIGETVFSHTARPTILRRLRLLNSNRYIQKLDGLKEYATGWALTRKSARLFFPDKICKIRFPRHQRDHEVYLSKVRLETYKLFTTWIPEHEIRSKMAKEHGVKGIQKRVVPDGLATILVEKVQEAVAIELELHGKNSKRYRQSFRGYATKSNLWAVWYVVANPIIGRHLMKVWRQLVAEHAGRPKFYWINLYDLVGNGMMATVYGLNGEQKLGKLLNPNSEDTCDCEDDPYATGMGIHLDLFAPVETRISVENKAKNPAPKE